MIKTIPWPADVERVATGEFRVTPFLLTECSAKGGTREEALQRAVSRLEERLSEGQIGDARTLAMLDVTSNLLGTSINGRGMVRLFVSFEDSATNST